VNDYYATTLAGARLERCYEIAPPRVQQYLREEARFVREHLTSPDSLLELGCGYGRLVEQLAGAVALVVGIDTSEESLRLARLRSRSNPACRFVRMDAARLAFWPQSFDVVVCAQNGVCAFQEDPAVLLAEALRVVRPGGRVLFSSYTEQFWAERLTWFQLQAAAGLVGPVDRQATRPGLIVCEDGLTIGTMTRADFQRVCEQLRVASTLTEVDGSSLFCEIQGRSAA
jgi:2-polyprenyl-6-hydroxyphenyl methylase/3-demethylubiquinone-9 3-methyltransferase